MGKKNNILYISYDGMTDPLGQSQVLAYVKRLVNYGHEFTILSFEKPEAFAKEEANIRGLLRGKPIQWVPLRYTKKPPILSTVYDLWKGWRKITALFRERQFDVAHSRGGHIAAVLGLLCKKKYGCRYIFDMRGWWADEKKESGLWNSFVYEPVYQFFKYIERKSFAESDCTVSLTFAGKNEIVQRGYKAAGAVAVIPTCVDFDVFPPCDENIRRSVREELHIPQSAITLLYSGALGTNYNNEGIFSLYRQLLAFRQDAHFLILSKDDVAYVKGELHKHGIADTQTRIISAPYARVHRYLMAGDIGVILYKKQYSTIGRSPTKLGEYWACGLPALSVKGIGDLDMLLEKYPGSGMLVDELNEAQTREALRALINASVTKQQLRSYAKDYFDVEAGVEKYHRILSGN